ncbi:hypothetical protein SAMN06296036_101225 [Pseudobacteriovorax antillogorgiicola]|uniref:Uncharacterized protein n=1 Tax=Pseudobacteriovorax antillogorgiicola TaxID=1513793 RepID=A0A1Y6B468_9BACT|nr:hypothetical protein EDD56_101261 [Pseudobacteriovorax antillogorgiicola]SME89095.1 hypothetical protein SAMN06296036_101225 [Pseudobacteriovorax antillogorgiicola]
MISLLCLLTILFFSLLSAGLRRQRWSRSTSFELGETALGGPALYSWLEILGSVLSVKQAPRFTKTLVSGLVICLLITLARNL